MVVPYNDEGYTLFSISTAEMSEYISRYESKLLFQHHTKKFYYLVDRLALLNSEIRSVLNAVKEVSEHWYKVVMGSLINMMLRRYMVFVLYPQQHGYYGDYFFAANYSQLKAYLQRVIGVLIHNYGFEDKYYALWIPRQELIKSSKLWGDAMIPFCETLIPKFKRITRI